MKKTLIILAQVIEKTFSPEQEKSAHTQLFWDAHLRKQSTLRIDDICN